jgi:hypothetical protein
VVLTQTLDAPTAADSRIFLYFQPDLSGLGSVIVSSLTGIQNFIPQLVINGDAQRGTPFVVSDSGQDLFSAANGTGRQLARLTLRITRSAPDEPSDSVESLLLDRVPPTLRGASSVSPQQLLPFTGNAGGIHNLIVEPGSADGERSDFAALLQRLGTGLLVTEVMGQGVNTTTGDYSRGASGFWVENGQLAYPVEEITIAGNLRNMLAGIVAVGTDVDPRSHVLSGSILLDRMTVAGE